MAGVEMRLYRHRKPTSPPHILLMRVPNDRDRYYRHDRTDDLRSHREKKHPIPCMVGFRVHNLDIHDSASSSLGWQRQSERIGQMSAAPDIAYRNTYLERTQRTVLEKKNPHRSPSPRSNSSLSYFSSNPSTHQYRTIYDYIRGSIRNIEQQRNFTLENLSSRISRPQNEDRTFRRALSANRFGAKSALSRTTSATTTQTQSSLFNFDLKSPESFVNYLNHSRVLRATTPNQLSERYEQSSFIQRDISD